MCLQRFFAKPPASSWMCANSSVYVLNSSPRGTVNRASTARLLGQTRGNDPRNYAKTHERQFVIVRVISWIIVFVKTCSNNNDLRTFRTEKSTFSLVS